MGGYGCCLVELWLGTMYQHIHAACSVGFKAILRGSSFLYYMHPLISCPTTGLRRTVSTWVTKTSTKTVTNWMCSHSFEFTPRGRHDDTMTRVSYSVPSRSCLTATGCPSYRRLRTLPRHGDCNETDSAGSGGNSARYLREEQVTGVI